MDLEISIPPLAYISKKGEYSLLEYYQWSLEPKTPLCSNRLWSRGELDQISINFVKIHYFSDAPAARSESILPLESVQNPIFSRAPAARSEIRLPLEINKTNYFIRACGALWEHFYTSKPSKTLTSFENYLIFRLKSNTFSGRLAPKILQNLPKFKILGTSQIFEGGFSAPNSTDW